MALFPKRYRLRSPPLLYGPETGREFRCFLTWKGFPATLRLGRITKEARMPEQESPDGREKKDSRETDRGSLEQKEIHRVALPPRFLQRLKGSLHGDQVKTHPAMTGSPRKLQAPIPNLVENSCPDVASFCGGNLPLNTETAKTLFTLVERLVQSRGKNPDTNIPREQKGAG